MRSTTLICFVLASITLAVYSRSLFNDFVEYDDGVYITQNQHIREGLSVTTVRWALTTFDTGNWHPLTWMSHALDVQIFGLNPAGHHFASIALQALNAILLFLLLWRATGSRARSLIVALLFTVHPLNVESVAWAAERKTLLSTLFLFLSVGAYGWYVRRPSFGRYASLLACFAIGLMAKPMIVTLPCVLLLMDYWPLGRMDSSPPPIDSLPRKSFFGLVVEKIPLLVLSAASALITVMAQARGKAIMPLSALPLAWRIKNAASAYVLYLFKAIWPAGLACFYPEKDLSWWLAALSVLLLGSIGLFAWQQRRRKPYLIVGWLWYLGTLVPVIGLVQVGSQAMADRYAYIPLIGIFLIAAWGFCNSAEKFSLSVHWQAVTAAAVLAGLTVLTVRQVGFWKDRLALWTRATEVTEANVVAEDNVGIALMNANRYDEAIVHFNNAVRLQPNEPASYIGLGYVLRDRDPQAAIQSCLAALGLTQDPKQLVTLYSDLGVAYSHTGDYRNAAKSFGEVLKRQPLESSAMMGLGSALLHQSAQRMQQELEKHPSAEGFSQLGSLLEQARDAEGARKAYQSALVLNTNLSSAKQGLERLTGNPR